MSIVRFIADLHAGHESMAKRRGFENVADHDEYIIKQWNSVVHKRDTTYILGDITMEKPEYSILRKLNGRKIVVGGNHDKPHHSRKLLEYIDTIAGMVQYKGIFLTHCPVHPMEMDYRIKYNIHGHIHSNSVMKRYKLFGYTIFSKKDTRYICVSCEHVDFKPKTLDELGINRITK